MAQCDVTQEKDIPATAKALNNGWVNERWHLKVRGSLGLLINGSLGQQESQSLTLSASESPDE
eukprot:scaffold601400_cov39-Prasinocladus_malaysianus.AAC.1